MQAIARKFTLFPLIPIWVIFFMLIMSVSVAIPASAEYFSSIYGYESIKTTNATGTYLTIGTSTVGDTYESISMSIIGAPSITALSATSVLYSSARLNANVTSAGNDTAGLYVRFGIGTVSQTAANFALYPSISAWVNTYHQGSNVYIDQTGLGGNTTYYYRAQVYNSYGTVTSTNEISFTTSSTVGLASNLIGYPTDTTITLTWTKASGATRTIIRYRTDAYPINETDGYSAYNGTSYQCIVTGLIPGQVYYFAAWGTGSPTSPTPSYLPMSTTPITPPSGSSSTPESVLPTLTIPANANQPPTTTDFNLEPFTSIVNYFVTSEGGLGMPVSNAWQMLVTMGVVFAGIATYIKIKNFFIAFFVVFVLTIGGVGLHLMQGYLVVFEIIIGMGVWAIDKYLQ